jgi:Tol biopolymer transport system component
MKSDFKTIVLAIIVLVLVGIGVVAALLSRGASSMPSTTPVRLVTSSPSPLPSPLPSSEPTRATPARIAFKSNRDGNSDLYVMDPDGSNVIQLTEGDSIQDVAWSPDGTRIAFTFLVSDSDIYIVEVDEGNITQLTDNDWRDHGPAWSPDGTRIAFSSARFTSSLGLTSDIYVIDVDGGNETRLTHSDDDNEWEPAWSPDGSRIVFGSDANSDLGDIYVMDADGKNVVRFDDGTDDPAYGRWLHWADSNPIWSPDGARIAFESFRSDDNLSPGIYIVDADGRNPVQLIDDDNTVHWDNTSNRLSGWSPDGEWILFRHDHTDDNHTFIYICVVDANGDNLTLLINNDTYGLPSLSPDGTRIVFESKRDGDPEIYVMDADGGNVIQLTDNDAEDREPIWSPR